VGVEGSAWEDGEGGGTKTRSTVDWRTRFAGTFVSEGSWGEKRWGGTELVPAA
jgi:hypothetical protein